MAVENVDVVRGIYEAFNRRAMDDLLKGFDPDVEIEETEDVGYAALLLRVLGPRFVILSGNYRGREEVRRLFGTVWEIAEWFEVEPQEFVKLGEQVAVPLRMSARARETQIEGEALTFHLWTFRDGKASRLQVFASRAEAVGSAGQA